MLLRLNEKLWAEAEFGDLAQNQVVDVVDSCFLSEFRNRELRIELVITHAHLCYNLHEILWQDFPNLDLNLVSRSKLILNMLTRSKAPENASPDHNAHLGRQRLSLLHGMSGDNHTRFLVSLANIGHNRPHETSSLGVHTRRRFIQQDNGRVAQGCHTNR